MVIKLKRILYIEILRILACFFVIFNHTGSDGFLLFASYPFTSIKYWLYLFLSIFCKFAVPCFFAISGVLLLKKDETLYFTYTRRILKITISLLAFSFLYYLIEIKSFSNINISVFLGKVISSSWNGTFWYLYAYIPFLMLLPLISALAKNLESKYFVYLFVLNFIFHWGVPLLKFFYPQIAINDFFFNNVKWAAVNVIEYPLLGYYIHYRMNITKKELAYLIGASGFTILISAALTAYKQSIGGGIDQAFHNTFVIINTAMIIAVCKYVVENKTEWFSDTKVKIIKSLGGATFGIYLFHVLFLLKIGVAQKMLKFLKITLGINDMLSCLIVCSSVFLAGYIATVILKRIPILKNLV